MYVSCTTILAVVVVFMSCPVAQCTSEYMECGSGVTMCGVLTLETGKGQGNYKHDGAAVHGLWYVKTMRERERERENAER